MHELEHLASAVEATREIVLHHLLAEELHDGSLGAPAEGLGHAQLVAVQRPQLDDAQPVQLRERARDFGLVDAVHIDHLLEAPLAQAADRHQQQLVIGHYRALLFEREFMTFGAGLVELGRELGKVAVQHAADLIHARERHLAAAGKHALDARLRQRKLARQIGVADAGRLQFGLDQLDQGLGGRHGRNGIAK